MSTSARIAIYLLSVGTIAVPSAPSMADPSELNELRGAWLQPSMDCQDVYMKTKAGMNFKRPVSVFAPAILVTGRTIKTPGAVCKVQRVTIQGDKKTLSLSCTTS